jgi:hypothetical protein
LIAAFAGMPDIKRIVLRARIISFFIYLSVDTLSHSVICLANIFIHPVYI